MPSYNYATGQLKFYTATDAVIWNRINFPAGLSLEEQWEYYLELRSSKSEDKEEPTQTIIDNTIVDSGGGEVNVSPDIVLADGSTATIFGGDLALAIRDYLYGGEVVFTLNLGRDFEL